MKRPFLIFILAFGTGALAQTSGSATGTAGATPATATGMNQNQAADSGIKNTTAAAACQSMVNAAKSKNFDQFMKMTTDMPAHERKNMKQTKNNFQKMQTQYMERLQDLNCGNEIVAKDHAVVETESKGEKRLIPFVQTNEGWKFDMKTYMSFYHTDEAQAGKSKM